MFDDLFAHEAFALIRTRGSDSVTLLAGARTDLDSLADIALTDLFEALPNHSIEFVDRGGFEASDADYASLVRTVIDEEIGQGEGANLVVARKYRATVADWGH